MLTREQILASKTQRKREAVIVPAWGGRVYIRELSAGEMDAFESGIAEQREAAKKAGKAYKPNVRARMIIACVCNENGEQIFLEGDEPEIADMAAHEVEPAVIVANRVNHFTRAHQEDLEKKYGTAGGSAPATDSPGNEASQSSSSS